MPRSRCHFGLLLLEVVDRHRHASVARPPAHFRQALGEVLQELFVLLQLEIQDHLLEVLVEEPSLILSDDLQDLVSGELAARVLIQLSLVQLLY